MKYNTVHGCYKKKYGLKRRLVHNNNYTRTKLDARKL